MPMGNRPRTVSIHILNDDSLLHVFYLYRPLFKGEAGPADWRYSGRWWYALAHVCRRWRNILLGSATYLDLSLLCTYGTPVADMLAHSPPLPLVVSYFYKNRQLTTKDEEGIILALKQHDRVRRVRLGNACKILEKLIVAMDEECPILEFLHISRPIEDTTTILRFSESFQAPHLRHLLLGSFALPTVSRLLTTAVGLVKLHLDMVHPSTYFHPNTLIRWISLMPQLEALDILHFSIPNRDAERRLTHIPIIAPVVLPNLHHLRFHGVSTYLEALVYRITIPRLQKLHIEFSSQLTFSVPRLLQSIIAAESFRLGNAVLTFDDKIVGAGVYPYGKTNVYALGITVKSCHLDWQASSMAQIFDSLSQIFSEVEHLALQHKLHSESSEEHNDVDHTEWRKLLRPFSNVKTLRVGKGLVKDLSRYLELEDGELRLELLSKLVRLEYSGRGKTRDFASFVNARRNAGRPVTLVRLPDPSDYNDEQPVWIDT